MHIMSETFYTVFLTRADVTALRYEMEDSDIDWSKYPKLDVLTDAIVELTDDKLLIAEEH
jgi:hypothetical protein